VNIEPNPRGLELMVQVQVPTDGRFPRGRMEERRRRQKSMWSRLSLLVGFLLTFLPAMNMSQGK
jgi:hypothetical protein